MVKNKQGLTNIQILGICHFVGLALISFYGANVYEMAAKFTSTIGYILIPTNRSIWEMSKMIVLPVSILFVVEYFIVGRKIKGFVPTHIIIASLLPIFMIITILLYQATFGALSMNGAQAVFFLALLIAALLASIFMLTSKREFKTLAAVCLILYVVLCVLYVIFSLNPPELGIFYDSSARVFGPMYQ